MSSATLWIKAFHIEVVAGWFAGLRYLPPRFVDRARMPGVVGDHHACRAPLCSSGQSGHRRNPTRFRLFGEASVLLFAATVVLVVFKPF
jgi:uncharacterized membrane protein